MSELRAGNLEFLITTNKLNSKLNESTLLEVGYFMQSFLPARALPLDSSQKPTRSSSFCLIKVSDPYKFVFIYLKGYKYPLIKYGFAA